MATLLEECAEIVWKIKRDAEVIGPGVERINSTGGVIAGALPLLYGMAEGIVTGATYEPEPEPQPEPAKPAMGTRRSRLHEGVGYTLSFADRHPRSDDPRRHVSGRSRLVVSGPVVGAS